MSGPSPGQGGGGYYQDPAAFYDQQQGQYDAQSQHNMNTVFEEDEPASSPELGRGDQQWEQGHYGYEQQQSGQAQGQGYDDYAYSQHQPRDEYNGYYQDQAAQGAPPSQEQWEPPYYPGYVYDAATNSYVTDPNWQPSLEGDQSTQYDTGHEGAQAQVQQQEQRQGEEHRQQYSYAHEQEQEQGETNGNGTGSGHAVDQGTDDFDGEDPYADDPYQLPDDGPDPYAQYSATSYDPTPTPETQNSYPQQSSEPFSYETNPAYGAATGSTFDGNGHSMDEEYSHSERKAEEEEAQNQYNSQPYATEQQEAPQEDSHDFPGQHDESYAAGYDWNGDNTDPYAQSHYETSSYPQQESNDYAPQVEHDPYSPTNQYSSQPSAPLAREPDTERRQEQPAPPRAEVGSASRSRSQYDDSYAQQPQRESSRGPSKARQAAASPPPLQPPPSSQSAYAPSPQTQQYSSFASVYDAAAQSDSKEPPYDPYAPVPKQSRERAYSGASNLSNRSRPSVAQVQAQVQSQSVAGAAGGRQVPFDPYAPSGDSLPIAQAQPPSVAPVSPQVQQRAPVPAPPVSGSQGTSSPVLSTSRTSTFSPPPRSSSGQSKPLTAAAGRAGPPQQRQQQPQQQQQATAGRPPASAFDIPPPRSNAPAGRQSTNGPAPRPPPSQAPAPRQAPTALAPSAPQPAESARAKSPSATQNRSHESQQSTSSSTSNSSGYIPPPPASSAPRAPPAAQRKPAPFGGVLQPPARRAPHQRGASAFGSDSPYGALPTGPLTSAYEPSSSGVGQIKEEEEEEEISNEPAEPEKADVAEQQREEEFVPSWMQATSTTTTPRGPYNPINPPPSNQPRKGPPPSSRQGPPASASASRPVDALAESVGQVSLQERPGDAARRQGPPPPRQQDHGAPPSRSGQPPRQQLPPQANSAPPPPSRLNPAHNQAPPASSPRGTAPRPLPPSGNGPPPRGQPPPPSRQSAPQPPKGPPQQAPRQPQQAPPSSKRPQPGRPPVVPQLHFEPPSGEREYRATGPSRPPPPAGQGSRSSTPVPMMVVEETAEEEEQYARDDQYASKPEEEEFSQRQQNVHDGYGVNDSPGYGESSNAPTGVTTPSTTYGGDWQADGYDYVSGAHSQQAHEHQQQPYDPYAPRSNEGYPRDPYDPRPTYSDMDRSDEDSLTPSVPQAASFGSPAGPPSARKPQQARPMPAEPTHPQGYGGYQPNSFDAYSAEPEQQQPYDPYAISQPGLSQQESYGERASGEVVDLGLDRRTAPLVSFGFGGRMLLVFPDGGSRFGAATTYDPANPYSVNAPEATTSTPTTVHVRKLADILPPATEAPFPGPIFLDGGKANSGKKRKEALGWLSKRIAELEEEVKHASSPPFSNAGETRSLDRETKRETRLLLFRLVKVFVENEGKLVGTPAVDDAVRAILTPASAGESDPSSLPTADQLAAAASRSSHGESAAPFVTYGVSASDLDEMSSLLLRGERREAVRFALDHKMWAHAFIIASCVDTDCWKDVTVEFLRSELTPSSSNPNGGGGQGREALRVAYSMFAGLGAESIEQFLPPRSLSSQGQPGLLPPAPIGAPPAESFNVHSRLPESTLESWRDTVGMIVANRTAGDSAALTALGDALASNGWIEAAHICYLLSPQTSLIGGLGSMSSRISLIGSAPSPSTGLDLESIKLTELFEFGCSLTPIVKGQEAFSGFPHLQAFRLFHASALADAGNVSQALKYTEAVVNTLKLATRPSPFYHPRLVAQVKLLGERLGAAPGQKETSSWIARKVPRPTVNSLWSTFEGGFNKFVSGEGEATPEQLAAKAEVAKVANGQPIGPFSHYSAIAPDSNSGTLSRAQSSTDLAAGNRHLANQPPPRPLSAAAPVPPALTSPTSNKPVHSPGPPPVKRAPFKTHHARSSSLGAFAGYDFNPTAPPPWQSYTPPAPRARGGGEEETPEPSETDRPKPQFAAVEDRFTEDDSGLISPMAQFTPSVSPAPGSNRAVSAPNPSHRRMTTAEELADLGIGNSKSKKPAFDTLDEELEAEEGGAPPPARQENGAAAPEGGPSTSKPDDKPTIKPSKSWLGGWFKREASPAAQTGPGPVKANLGEQKTFYYDEKLKRWVNNSGKGGDETPPAIVPPPRASTASPSRAMRGSPRFGSPAPPVPPMPPQRSQTAGPPPLSRSATSSDLRSQSQTGELRPPSRPSSAADGPGGARGGARRNKPKYVVVPP